MGEMDFDNIVIVQTSPVAQNQRSELEMLILAIRSNGLKSRVNGQNRHGSRQDNYQSSEVYIVPPDLAEK